MKDKKYILFDLDGTITDSSEGIVNSVKYALEKFKIKEKDNAKLYKFIGPPLINSFMECYGFDKEKAVKAVEYYREYYTEKGMFENRLYRGIKDLLLKLNKSGKKIILATSKPEEFAKKILEYFEIDEFFFFVGGATMDEKRTEKEEIIEYVLKENKIKSDEAVMIGDRKYDINASHSFNIKAIGVLFGFAEREELTNAKADYIVENTEEILKILL